MNNALMQKLLRNGHPTSGRVNELGEHMDEVEISSLREDLQILGEQYLSLMTEEAKTHNLFEVFTVYKAINSVAQVLSVKLAERLAAPDNYGLSGASDFQLAAGSFYEALNQYILESSLMLNSCQAGMSRKKFVFDCVTIIVDGLCK